MGSGSIRDLARVERPREKLVARGASALSTAELVALILRSGTRQHGVMASAEAVVSLLGAAEPECGSLRGIPGVGAAGACSILAAIELGRRLACGRGPRIRQPGDVVALLQGVRDRRQEQFVVLTADGDGHLLRRRTVFVGTLDRCLVHPREVFAEAIADRAAAVFLAHNHPSGNAEPSDDDIAVTRRLVEVGVVMGIQVRDHVIVTRGAYYSFKEHELL
jgi:DNA repair protein RadC